VARTQGILEGDTPKHIRQLLRESSFCGHRVSEVAQKEAKRQRSFFSLARGVSTGDLSLFTRQFGDVGGARTSARRIPVGRVAADGEAPRSEHHPGGSCPRDGRPSRLPDGLAGISTVFPEIYSLDRRGRRTVGKLDVYPGTPCRLHRGREQIRQKILAAMLYPIVLSVMCFAIVCGLMVYVVPKVVAVFESAKGKLPLITQVLIATSDFIRNYGIYMVIAAVLAAFLFQALAEQSGQQTHLASRGSCTCPWLEAVTRPLTTGAASREPSAFFRKLRPRS